MKASHRFQGIVYPAMLSMGAEIDQRIWSYKIALGQSSMECGGTTGCHTRSNGRSFAALFAEPRCTGLTALLLHDRDYLRLQG